MKYMYSELNWILRIHYLLYFNSAPQRENDQREFFLADNIILA